MRKNRTNEEWVEDLTSSGLQQEEAVEDLRHLLLRVSLYIFQRNQDDLTALEAHEKYALPEDCAQEALMVVLSQLKDFRGEAKFTSWVFSIAANVTLLCIRRERWKRVSLERFEDNLDSLDWVKFHQEEIFDDPARAALQTEVCAAIRDVIRDRLTPRQRHVLKWMVFDQVPMDVFTQQFGTNRNAVYKTLHDSRRKIKAYLEARGFRVEEIQDLFSLK